MDTANPPQNLGLSAELPANSELQEQIALLPEPAQARLHGLRAAMAQYVAWESAETNRLLHVGCFVVPLLMLAAGGVVFVFAGLPIAVTVTVGLWVSELVVVALWMAHLSSQLQRQGLERFDGFSTVPADDELTVTVLLALPEAIAGPERLHYILASLLTRGGVESAEVARAVDRYKKSARALEKAGADGPP